MKNIFIEINNKITESTYILCHNCNQLKNSEEIITCTIDDCDESYCSNCISLNPKNKNSFYELKKESEENGWVCLKCQNICNCKKCNPINIQNINQKEEKNKNLIINHQKKKIVFFSKKIEIEQPEKITIESGKDAYLIDTLYNGFKIVQDKSSTKFPYIPSQKPTISKLESQLIKVARSCEHFYRHKCIKNYFKKKCYICGKKEHHTNELIRFSTSKQFINYLRYLFVCMENILNYNYDIFCQNKEKFLEYYKNYEKGLTKWGFKNPKIICKLCILEILNKPNSLSFFHKNIKDLGNTLIDTDNDNSNETENEMINNIKKKDDNDKKSIKIYFEEKTFLTMQKLYNVLFQSVFEFIMVIKKLNIGCYNRMTSFGKSDIIDLYQQNILIFQRVKNNYKKIKDYLINYIHNMNEFVTYVYSIIIKDDGFINNLIISKIEIKHIHENFFHSFDNLIVSFDKFMQNLNNQIK